VRYHAATEISDGRFATAARREEVHAELASAGAGDILLEILSGVLVGIRFSIDVYAAARAATRVEEILWATSLVRVGPLEIADLAAV
jgi:hypothetical protein